jgi:hypothetical protein
MLFAFVAMVWATLPRGFTAMSASRMAQIAQDASCALPPSFVVRDFRGRTNDTGATLAEFHFSFSDSTTGVTTLCRYNSSSISTTPGGLTPRYACDDLETKFIWIDDQDALAMVERVCVTETGYGFYSPCCQTCSVCAAHTCHRDFQYEVSGSIRLHLQCNKGTQNCASNTTLTTGQFTSISPIRDPTL